MTREEWLREKAKLPIRARILPVREKKRRGEVIGVGRVEGGRVQADAEGGGEDKDN